MHALYHVIDLAFNNPPGYTIPKNLTTPKNRFQHNINIEEVCNGVVHPITKETITEYTKLMDDPALEDLWVPAMSKELHHLAQGKEGVTGGTNTIFYLTHDEIRRIPKDRTVTYTQIVINHCPQKDNPNRVQITVGVNLIHYPYKLTTRTADMVSAKIMWNSVISMPGAKFGGADIKQHVSQNTARSIRIHANAPQALPRRHHSTLQPPGKKHSMAMSTWRSGVACMGYHKLAS
jgi:hypothetical protein